jgi:hypothetical protein
MSSIEIGSLEIGNWVFEVIIDLSVPSLFLRTTTVDPAMNPMAKATTTARMALSFFTDIAPSEKNFILPVWNYQMRIVSRINRKRLDFLVTKR